MKSRKIIERVLLVIVIIAIIVFIYPLFMGRYPTLHYNDIATIDLSEPNTVSRITFTCPDWFMGVTLVVPTDIKLTDPDFLIMNVSVCEPNERLICETIIDEQYLSQDRWFYKYGVIYLIPDEYRVTFIPEEEYIIYIKNKNPFGRGKKGIVRVNWNEY
jgi:hypothetical protein